MTLSLQVRGNFVQLALGKLIFSMPRSNFRGLLELLNLGCPVFEHPMKVLPRTTAAPQISPGLLVQY